MLTDELLARQTEIFTKALKGSQFLALAKEYGVGRVRAWAICSRLYKLLRKEAVFMDFYNPELFEQEKFRIDQVRLHKDYWLRVLAQFIENRIPDRNYTAHRDWRRIELEKFPLGTSWRHRNKVPSIGETP